MGRAKGAILFTDNLLRSCYPLARPVAGTGIGTD